MSAPRLVPASGLDPVRQDLAVALKRLRLPAVAVAVAAVPKAHQSRLSWLRDLVQVELQARATSTLRRRLDKSGLPVEAESLADLDLGRAAATPADRVCWAHADWVRTRRNLVVTGDAHSMRHRLVCAMGRAAASHGFSVRYLDVADLLEAWNLALLGDRLALFREELWAVDVLILDGWGVVTLRDGEDETLRAALRGRYGERRPILVGSCLPPTEWLAWLRNSHCGAEVVQHLLASASVVTTQ